MNQDSVADDSVVDRIVQAVLYEGYILYPYRPSVKNRQRWTFGGLMPPDYCAIQRSGDAATFESECLVAGSPEAQLDVTLGFLQLTQRQVGRVDEPLSNWPENGRPQFTPVDCLNVDGAQYHTWQEAVERQVRVGNLALRELAAAPHRQAFVFPAARSCEPLYDDHGWVAGVLLREQQPLCGELEIRAEPVGIALGPMDLGPMGLGQMGLGQTAGRLYKVALRIANCAALENPARATRDAALLHALISTHAVLRIAGGEFVSLLETPDACRAAAAGCRQKGLWPVLVGRAGQRDTVLASPIILYDYPQVAAESPGDLFDGAEIDEILTLRILTLTADEKRAMTAVDARARALLERTEALGPGELANLHGTIREWRSVPPRGEPEHAS